MGTMGELPLYGSWAYCDVLLHENLDLNDSINIRRGALANVDPGGMLCVLSGLMGPNVNIYGVPFVLFYRCSITVCSDPGLSASSEPATISQFGERCKQ